MIQRSQLINAFATIILLAGCGRTPGSSDTQEAWNQVNSPWIMSGSDTVTDFWNLPLSGEVAQKGWSDYYWPTYQGGISYRWLTKSKIYPAFPRGYTNTVFALQSPAEKYDILLNRYDFPTVASERYRTRVMKTIPGTSEFDPSYEIPAWEGLCHGWAPAAHNFKEPKRVVTVTVRGNNKVVFYPSDIKALLTYYQQYGGNRSTQTVFAGQRCNNDFSKLQEKYNRGEISWETLKAVRESEACRDTNAATLHLALANEIGRAKRGFIVDITRDAEVWNQPVNSFESQITGARDGASDGAAPGTVKEVQIKTLMSYSVEVPQSTVAVGAKEQTVEFEYVLELNDRGQVIGGRWLSDARPDFLWRESTPTFQGYFRRIADLYQASIGE